MDWADKLRCVRQLGVFELDTEFGKWRLYTPDIHIGKYGITNGPFNGYGGTFESPEAAIEDWWDKHVTNIPKDLCIIVTEWKKPVRYVRWSGEDWVDVSGGWY